MLFRSTGNLTLPNIGGTIEASITTVYNALQLRSNTGTEMDYYDSADPDNHWGYISIDGTGTYIAQRSNVAGNVLTVDWTFDPTGNLITSGNLKLVTNSNLWNFDTNGALTFPGDTLQIGLIAGNSGLHSADSNVNIDTNGYLWTFDLTGNLTLPSNVANINYANGVSILDGIGGGSYGNANVANFLADFGSNAISTTGNISASDFIGGGNANVLSLTTRNGDSNHSYASPQIVMGYAGTADYPSFIHTTHNAGTPVDNTIEFWTCDGTQFGTFPANAVLGLTVKIGRAHV